MDDSRVDRYLDRIGATRPARADAGALAELQLRHLHSVPFENLSIHLGEPIVLEEAALVDKLVGRHPGRVLLRAQRRLRRPAVGPRLPGDPAGGPRPHPRRAEPAVRPPRPAGRHRRHRELAGRRRLRQLQPPSAAARQPGRPARPGGQLPHHPRRRRRPGGQRRRRPQYRLESHPRRLSDFEPTCWWHQTSPASHFTRSLVCSRLTGDGRVTLRDRTLIETTPSGRHERVLDDDAEVLDTYRARFGIHLDRLPPPRAQAGGR
jgi:N-hydroxyarylamine O-acetyltransferase